MNNELIGKEKYFVHSGTWKNDYEWRIEKVKITGIKINEKGKQYVEFSFGCTGYEYSASYLKNTLASARKFAVKLITAEKEKQIKQIMSTP